MHNEEAKVEYEFKNITKVDTEGFFDNFLAEKVKYPNGFVWGVNNPDSRFQYVYGPYCPVVTSVEGVWGSNNEYLVNTTLTGKKSMAQVAMKFCDELEESREYNLSDKDAKEHYEKLNNAYHYSFINLKFYFGGGDTGRCAILNRFVTGFELEIKLLKTVTEQNDMKKLNDLINRIKKVGQEILKSSDKNSGHVKKLYDICTKIYPSGLKDIGDDVIKNFWKGTKSVTLDTK